MEQGVQYDGDGGTGIFTFSNTLLRYGLFPNMELRVGRDGFIYQNTNSGVEQWFPAFSELSVGTKIKCFDGVGAIPAVSVLADFSIPNTATKGYEVDHLAPSLYLLFENPVNNWFCVGYNVVPNGMVLCLHQQHLQLSAWVSVRQIVWDVLWKVTTISINLGMPTVWT